MSHLGDYDAAAVIYHKFTTYRPSTGAAFTLAGTPAVSIYKDNNTTQTTTGVTLTADFDSVAGLNHLTIDTADAFYAAGSFFQAVITTGTVDSVSVVGSVVASWTIRKDSSLKPTTAARTLDVSAGGEAGLDWANIGSPTTAQNLSATNIDVDQIVASVSGAVGSVTGAVGSVTGNVGGNVTGTVGSVVGAVGSVTGNVGGNVVGSVASVTAGVTLAASAIQAIWDALTAALTTAGSIGKKLADWTIGTAQTGDSFARLGAPAGASVSADIAAVKADSAAIKLKTDSLTFTVANQVDANTQSINDVTIIGDGSGTPFNV